MLRLTGPRRLALCGSNYLSLRVLVAFDLIIQQFTGVEMHMHMRSTAMKMAFRHMKHKASNIRTTYRTEYELTGTLKVESIWNSAGTVASTHTDVCSRFINIFTRSRFSPVTLETWKIGHILKMLTKAILNCHRKIPYMIKRVKWFINIVEWNRGDTFLHFLSIQQDKRNYDTEINILRIHLIAGKSMSS